MTELEELERWIKLIKIAITFQILSVIAQIILIIYNLRGFR